MPRRRSGFSVASVSSVIVCFGCRRRSKPFVDDIENRPHRISILIEELLLHSFLPAQTSFRPPNGSCSVALLDRLLEQALADLAIGLDHAEVELAPDSQWHPPLISGGWLTSV
jgi:hypothetical protein